MSDSPFHGIFSAFSAGQVEKVTAKKSEKQSHEPIVPMKSASEAINSRQQSGQIAVDIYEHEGYYIVRAPIAGVKLQDLDIEVDGKSLTIRGKRDESEQIQDSQYFLKECFWGEFSRTISLPVVIDAKRVKATFSKDGILKVFVAKAEEKVKIIRVGEN